MGPSQEQSLIALTLRDYIRFVKQQTPTDPCGIQPKGPSPKIGANGALLEWSQPFNETKPSHRHLSHTYGLTPGRLYSIRKTPLEAEAIRKSLDKRLKAGWAGVWAGCHPSG